MTTPASTSCAAHLCPIQGGISSNNRPLFHAANNRMIPAFIAERYDRQTAAATKQAAEKLDTSEPFKNLSRSENDPASIQSASSTH